MAKNSLHDLRNMLFEQMERLSDKAEQVTAEDLNRAKQMNAIAKTIVDTAKAEVAYYNATGGDSGNKFFDKQTQPQLPAKPNGQAH